MKKQIKAGVIVPGVDSKFVGHSIALHGESGPVAHAMSAELMRPDGVLTDIGTVPDLAGLSLEDRFAESFRVVHGMVDPELDLGF